ncbi:MAG: shikimate dehydrogenase [Lachnospiraceae bacterium]|nr:shikimate dehydrogenase [Lachnospiraceae bacterium]
MDTREKINGKTRVCGLMGYPVAHTLSPIIHNTLAEKMNLNMVYVPFPVAPEQVNHAIAGAYALDLLGLNVTVPHKSAVIAGLKEMDELAAKIGAVNTLVRVPGGYKGYNTDMTGLYRALLSEQIQIREKQIILLGAGGAARAVAFMCAYYGARKVYLLNRTLDKAQRVAEEVNSALSVDCIVPMRMEDYKNLPEEKYLAIQGTSVGLYPNVEDAVIRDMAFYERIHTGYDLIYKPAKTMFMKYVEQAGGIACNGLKMLLYQGIDAFELWNQCKVPEEIAMEIYQRLEKETRIHE